MLATSAPTIAVMDADLQHDETILPTMLAAIEKGGGRAGSSTRYAAGGSLGDWNKTRKTMSQLATVTSRAILGSLYPIP